VKGTGKGREGEKGEMGRKREGNGEGRGREGEGGELERPPISCWHRALRRH